MSTPVNKLSLPLPDDAIQVRGCTNLNQLQQLTSCNPFKMGFFYNPHGDCQIYHITCELSDNIDKTDNANSLSDHTFYYKLNEKSFYKISCNLISHSLIVQFLNKNIHGIELRQSEESQQEFLMFSKSQRENLEFHLQQYLFNYLAPKQINKRPGDNILTSSNISDNNDKIMPHPRL